MFYNLVYRCTMESSSCFLFWFYFVFFIFIFIFLLMCFLFPFFGCFYCFVFVFGCFVVAEIFTILVMLMPNVTKFNLFRTQSCKKFCVAEPTTHMQPYWHQWGQCEQEDVCPFIEKLAGLG